MAAFDLWDSPLTGAYLIWRFARAFEARNTSGPNLLLAFPALIILITPDLAAPLASTKVKSISDYTFHFIQNGDSTPALLGGLIREKRELVRLSLSVAFASSLLQINRDGKLHANPGPGPNNHARQFRKDNDAKAQKLGEILADVPAEKIGYYLGVNF